MTKIENSTNYDNTMDNTEIVDVLNNLKVDIIEKNVINSNKMVNIQKKLSNLNAINIQTITSNEQFEIEKDVLSLDLQKKQEEKQFLEEELKKMKEETIKLKLSNEELKKEFKDTYEALKLAAHYYKSAFNIHLELDNTEENVFILRFFTQRKNTDQYYIKIRMNKEEKQWELLDMLPCPDKYEAIQEHLKKTGDIQGFLPFARKFFMKMGGHD